MKWWPEVRDFLICIMGGMIGFGIAVIIYICLNAPIFTVEPPKVTKTTNYTQQDFDSSKRLIQALEDKVKKLEQEQKELKQDFAQWSGMWKQLFPKGGS